MKERLRSWHEKALVPACLARFARIWATDSVVRRFGTKWPPFIIGKNRGPLEIPVSRNHLSSRSRVFLHHIPDPNLFSLAVDDNVAFLWRVIVSVQVILAAVGQVEVGCGWKLLVARSHLLASTLQYLS